METSKVYFTRDISPDGLIKIFDAMGVKLKGNVAVKISTGEPGGHNFLSPQLIEPLVKRLNGTIVECLTAYRGKRFEVADHWQAIADHGFQAIAPCDIMDENGEMQLRVDGVKRLKNTNLVGEHLRNYDSMLMLSHFKGHQMAGMGGALKNMSIGVASKRGKAWIHSWGNTTEPDECWNFAENQDAFLESMAEACMGVMDYMGRENIVYINVANNLSIDCDCIANPATPKMKDIGIFASTDPVAIDQSCYDTIMNSVDEGKEDLVARMLDKHAIHIVEEAEELGLGRRNYEIIDIDNKGNV